jgi:hypothetical protein
VPLAQVRDLLGHASITTTERYDNQKLENLQASVLKLESGKTLDATDVNRTAKRVDDADKVSSFFQEKAKSLGERRSEIDRETEPNPEDENDLENWLGGRDSEPFAACGSTARCFPRDEPISRTSELEK